MKKIASFALLLGLAITVGCNSKKAEVDVNRDAELPVFSLWTSEYPSWSTYVVAAKAGLVNPEKGGTHGPLEAKYGVDLVLSVKDYDPCIVAYGSGNCDAVCITTLDALKPSLTRPGTVIMPTSTSAGGDVGIAVGVDRIAELKGVKVYGLDNSVSEYTHYRCVKLAGFNPNDFPFENLDPSPAATALQSGSNEVKAICVWNPFALQTLRKNKNAKMIYSSANIEGEIIDSVVVGNDSLAREGGKDFATLLCAIQYEVNNRIRDSKTSAVTVSALKDDFAPSLTVQDMTDVVLKDTKFYYTADDGIGLFTNKDFPKTFMETVIPTCEAIGILEKGSTPVVSFNPAARIKANLTFSTEFMTRSKE